MIVSAVIDPSAFGTEGITDTLSKREAIAFLKSIIDNGVLLDSPTRELLREALEETIPLDDKMGKRIRSLLEEIRKQHKKFVACCNRKDWPDNDSRTIADKCSILARLLKADVIVTQPANLASIQHGIAGSVEVVSISDVSESKCEDKRREMSRLDAPLDQKSSDAIEEILGRAVRYSATLRIFDYRMVGDVKGAKRYLAGIQFLASIWERWCVVGEPTSRTIELYTVGERVQVGYLTGTQINTRVIEYIETPLRNATSATVTHFVKQDTEPRIFHTRGFVAKGRAYTIDPGFDAIGLNGPVRRCVFNASLAAEKHFAECRGLRTLDDSKGADGAVIDTK